MKKLVPHNFVKNFQFGGILIVLITAVYYAYIPSNLGRDCIDMYTGSMQAPTPTPILSVPQSPPAFCYKRIGIIVDVNPPSCYNVKNQSNK